jgi:hypothetical protein
MEDAQAAYDKVSSEFNEMTLKGIADVPRCMAFGRDIA